MEDRSRSGGAEEVLKKGGVTPDAEGEEELLGSQGARREEKVWCEVLAEEESGEEEAEEGCGRDREGVDPVAAGVASGEGVGAYWHLEEVVSIVQDEDHEGAWGASEEEEEHPRARELRSTEEVGEDAGSACSGLCGTWGPSAEGAAGEEGEGTAGGTGAAAEENLRERREEGEGCCA